MNEQKEIELENKEPKEMDMSPWNLVGAERSFGFQILARRQELKLDLISSGGPGVESFIDAIITSGMTRRVEIVKEVCDVVGEHAGALVDDILAGGCGVYWEYNETTGGYRPISLH